MMKDRFIAPRVEDIKLSQLYAISINPQEEWSSNQQITAWTRKVYTSLRSIVRGVELELFVESSPTGRLHFHGTILIIDVVLYLRFLKELMTQATFAIKEIKDTYAEDEDDYVTWDKYCIKQAHIFGPLFDHNTVSYPLKIVSVKEPDYPPPEWKAKDL